MTILLLLIGLSFYGLLFYSLTSFSQETQGKDKSLTTATDNTNKNTPGTSIKILEVTINTIEGDVEVKKVDEKEWVTAEVGMKLKEGSKISTGFKSKAVLLFADNSTVVVKPLTQLNINRFNQQSNEVQTKLGLRIGAVRVKVNEKQSVKTDMKIYTPNATASVRGTEIEEIKTSSHFGDTIAIESGKVAYGNKESSIIVQGGESTNQNLINPIENALMQIVVQIAPIGTTDLENRTLISVSATGGLLLSNANSNTSDPSLDRIISQESPTYEQNESKIDPYSICSICGHVPCTCPYYGPAQ